MMIAMRKNFKICAIFLGPIFFPSVVEQFQFFLSCVELFTWFVLKSWFLKGLTSTSKNSTIQLVILYQIGSTMEKQ